MRFGSSATASSRYFCALSQLASPNTLPAEEILGDHAREAVETHDLGVPHAHHVQRARMLRVQLQRVERLLADLAGVLDLVARAHGERVPPDRARQLEMSLGVVRICRDRAPRVLFCASVQAQCAARHSSLNSPRSTASWAALTSAS